MSGTSTKCGTLFEYGYEYEYSTLKFLQFGRNYILQYKFMAKDTLKTHLKLLRYL